MDELSDSEEEYSQNEKLLLDNARRSMRGREKDSDEDEVFGLDLDDDDDEEGKEDDFYGGEDDDVDMQSDIEDAEDDLPDDRAWGKKRRNFYNTDFVDKDYGGLLEGKEAEAAEMEEEEAKKIQKRLLEELDDADFIFKEDPNLAPKGTKEVIKSDLSQLSKRQKLDIFTKESPEFSKLVDDFRAKMTEVKETLLPIIELCEAKMPSEPILQFLKTKLQITLNYCTNISFYLLLKSECKPVKDHPVLKSLVRYRQLLEELSPVEAAAGPLLKLLKSNQVAPQLSAPQKKKKILNLLKKAKKRVEKVEEPEEVEEDIVDEEPDISDAEEEVAVKRSSEDKRAITYEMAKNKGLTPKRSKEQRNPRVKHRMKYKKAKIRRRGQVRTVRPEIPVYGGEPGGIKIGLTKSIKLK